MKLVGDSLVTEVANYNNISKAEAKRSLAYVCNALRNAFENRGVTKVKLPRLFSLEFIVALHTNHYCWHTRQNVGEGVWYVRPKLKMGRNLRNLYRNGLINAVQREKEIMESGNVPSEIFQVERNSDGSITRFY